MPIFVNINLNSGADDGTSWENAYHGPTALQKALGVDPSLDDEIWVAQGTYTPSQGWSVASGTMTVTPRTESFRIPNDCRVYGGFVGTETSLAQRDITAYPTILSGNLDGDPANNAYHVVFFYQVSENTVLDGVTVTNGRANGVFPNSRGGGIYNNGDGVGILSNPTINSCLFSDNSTNDFGGAVYNTGVSGGTSSPIFDNCVFSDNSTNNFGGAVYNIGISGGTSSPIFDNCVFSDNSASRGGAVYNNGQSGGTSSPSFMNVTFFNNSATNSGTAILNNSASSNITNSILWNYFDNPNTPSLIENFGSSTTTITYSDVVGSSPGSGNINADPLFINQANPIGPDNIWMTNDDGLALQPCSPCVGAGTPVDAPPTDILCNTRPSPPSMGAYEVPVFTFTINPSSLTVDCFNNGTLTLSGVNNENLLWQYSEDRGLTWIHTTNTSSIYTFENLTTNTLFRVQVTTTDCPNTILYSEIASVLVDQNCTTTIQITTTSPLPSGIVNVPYSASLTYNGGTPPVTWSILETFQSSDDFSSANDSTLKAQAAYAGLPPGLRLNAFTGEISGTPTLAGSFTFTAQVIDSVGNVALRNLTIIILLLPSNRKVELTNTEIMEGTKLHDWVISSRDTNIKVGFES